MNELIDTPNQDNTTLDNNPDKHLNNTDATPLAKQATSKGRWQKGTSGNPAGRKKGANSLADALERALSLKDVQDGVNQITRREAICKKLTALAIKGDSKAMKLVLEFGMAKPAMEISTTGNVNVFIARELQEDYI